MTSKYPKQLTILINLLKKFPGIGAKTAERLAFHLLDWDEGSLKIFSNTLENLKKTITKCPECGCLLSHEGCNFCDPSTRNTDIICIISSPKDAYLIEETNSYTGLYHVIDHLLSPIEGFNEEDLHIEKLKKRIDQYKIKEVILGLDSTLEGDATSLFLKNKLSSWNIGVTRLAFGLPVGSSLEYIDGGTLSRALMGRQNF